MEKDIINYVLQLFSATQCLSNSAWWGKNKRNEVTNIKLYDKDQINRQLEKVRTSNERHLIKLTAPVAQW